MLFVAIFMFFVLAIVLMILLFCNSKIRKKNANTILDNLSIHIKLSLLKHFYFEFDCDMDNNSSKGNNKKKINSIDKNT